MQVVRGPEDKDWGGGSRLPAATANATHRSQHSRAEHCTAQHMRTVGHPLGLLTLLLGNAGHVGCDAESTKGRRQPRPNGGAGAAPSQAAMRAFSEG